MIRATNGQLQKSIILIPNERAFPLGKRMAFHVCMKQRGRTFPDCTEASRLKLDPYPGLDSNKALKIVLLEVSGLKLGTLLVHTHVASYIDQISN